MRFKALWVVGIFFASTSIALAQDTYMAWTASKAEKIVTRDATVRLPLVEKKALESELRAAVMHYSTLEHSALESRDERLASRLHSLRNRYSTALRKVQTGLQIDALECAGAAAAVGGDRFRRFRCGATSEALEIPTAVVTWDAERITSVVEGEPQIAGPFAVRLNVHVTGKSTIAYRQVE